MQGRRVARGLAATTAAIAVLSGLGCTGVLWSDDPISSLARPVVERAVNGHLAAMRERGATSGLTWVDRAELHLGVVVGTTFGGLVSPEGSAVLWHAVYGDGSELRLDATYFRDSPWIRRQIARRGRGDHGPIAVRPEDDWRLALALNPVYLHVAEDRIAVGHPDMRFAAADGKPVYTVVPIGKLRIRVWDNLVSALGAKPFACWAEWRP